MTRLEVSAVRAELWQDLEALFSAGEPARCWCMWPRVPLGAMRARTSEQNQADMKRLVEGGAVPGLLAYLGGRPVGWVAIASRSSLTRLAAAADPATWVIACLYVSSAHRGSGVARVLLEAAVRYARGQGAGMVEAILRGWRTDGGDSGRHGLFRSLREAGFEEVDAESEGVHFRARLSA